MIFKILYISLLLYLFKSKIAVKWTNLGNLKLEKLRKYCIGNKMINSIERVLKIIAPTV